ncbi:Uncharacterised protein [Porphyromonas macacae]|uniref:Immunity protein 12 domain-containing protein n=1 Tax=Porphyromonas macacae TaxID=28115 RepID=A0A379EB91_9PORP|nr:hypothetical protein [Porphyromonas macacae]SUB89710.1 Uncharacterised protein [Porphyromonas macacae]
MDFSIVSDTAGARVGELVSELRHILKNRINSKFQEYSVSIGIAVRCLPQNYNRKSFVRYTKADNYLTIDFCVTVEEYLKKYKIEQRYELGKTFLEWLKIGLQNKAFIKNNPNLDRELLLNYVTELGQKEGWFVEEIDWSLDLDK